MEIAISVSDVIFTTLLFITLLKDKEFFYCFLEQCIIIMTYEKNEQGFLNNFI